MRYIFKYYNTKHAMESRAVVRNYVLSTLTNGLSGLSQVEDPPPSPEGALNRSLSLSIPPLPTSAMA